MTELMSMLAIRKGVTTFAFATLVLLMVTPVLSQGLSATAKPVAAPPTVDANALSRRIDELERRIRELEKTKADNIEQDKEDGAREKKLEQRLSAIEGAQQKALERASSAASDPTPAIVRAPFVVKDENGKTLFRVDRSPTTGVPRATVGEQTGSAAVLVASPGGGVLQLVDSANQVRLVASATNDRSGVMTTSSGGKLFVGAFADGTPLLQAFNKAGIPVAELRTMLDQSGQLVIADEAGNKLVIAGVATSGVGVVKTGPGGLGPAAVMGNIAKPASEIQGRKR